MTSNGSEFRRDNHYVPCVSLRHFASSDGKLQTYRTLVSRSHIPLWKEASARGIAYHSHLYTRIAGGHKTDEIERWLASEFEDPAADAIQKATSDEQLTSKDWKCLVRFLAAQDVRTPARLIENLARWHADLPSLLNSTLRESIRKLEVAKKAGESVPLPKFNNSEYLPFRATAEIEPGQDTGNVKAEVVVGRGLWIFSMRHLLASSASILLQHTWSILRPPDGLCWFTSDDPVIRLNYIGKDQYNFKGGWGNPGTEIFLPLSPNHLLYAQVGHRPPPRGTIVPRAQGEMIRRFVAEHAHRMIFARSSEPDIPKLRPRIVSEALFRTEEERWRRWDEEQTAAERKLMGWTGTDTA